MVRMRTFVEKSATRTRPNSQNFERRGLSGLINSLRTRHPRFSLNLFMS